jgi:transglutaminase-like putative cysteine protease
MTFAFRAFSVAFLGWHWGLLFPGLAEPVFLAVLSVAALAGGAALRHLRPWLALPLGAGVFAAFWMALAQVPSGLDALPLWTDRQMVFAVLPFALAWTEGWAFTGRRDRRGWERLVHGVVVCGLFWTQGAYHVTMYPQPVALALAFGLFLASELILLAGAPPRGRAWAPALLVITAGIGLLWGLFGRYEDQSVAAGGGLMKPDLFQFDFAPLVRLEDEITLGDNLVLLYREEGSPQRRYLRRLVLDAWDPNRGFSLSGSAPPSVARRVQNFAPTGSSQDRTPVRQEYYLVNLDPSSLLALNEPVTVTPYGQWDHSSFVNAYRVDSLVASPDAVWAYNDQTSDGLSAADRAFFLKGGDDPEIKALAVSVTKGAVTPFEKANAIEQYLRDNFFYSLRPGNPGARGALKHFLFEGKKGYCSYFAFSMTLMLRSVGVPARIAVGFATDPSDAVLGFTPVRAFQAHAWVEVPLGTEGWIDFDPTSSTPAPGEPFQFPKGTDPQMLSKMIAEILGARPQPLAAPDPGASAPTPANPWARMWESWMSRWPWAIVLLLAFTNELTRHRWRWARDERSRIALRWADLVFRARRAGCGPRPGETPEAWAGRQGDLGPDLGLLASQVSRVRYAPHPEPGLERDCVPGFRILARTFDRRRPRRHRILAVLFPWWPR